MNQEKAIRARFAPSPTGYLHVGGARSALFNWLFCRRHGGTFVLRIEDTDLDRHVRGAERQILEDLGWLGITCDEGPDAPGPFGPYRQSERRGFYKAAEEKLLAAGHAYYAFDTPEELDALRQKVASDGRGFRYPRPASLPTAADAARAREAGRPVVVRFKTPEEAITVHDEILGEVTFAAGEIDDFVIVKSNGWPTYHLAVVVDDAEMRITHVLRAQEHLMNTAKHVFLQRALGLPTPRYAHLPLVFNIDGTKMSKRDKHKVVRKVVRQRLNEETLTRAEAADIAGCAPAALDDWLKKADAALNLDQVGKLAAALNVSMPEIDVHDFRLSGYLPEALVNFIALIGWSPGDDREMLTKDELIATFSLDRINKTAGRFDRRKLLAMNTDWCARLSPERLLAAFKDWARLSGSSLESLDDATAARVLAACAGFRTFADLETKAGILFQPDDAVVYEPKAVKKFLEKGGQRGFDMLERLLPVFERAEAWSAQALDALIRDYCERQGAKLGDVAQPVRVAVAGRAVSPAIGETLALLGRERTLNRLRRCLGLRQPKT